MRILVGECKQEVSSFNPSPSHLDDFVVLTGDAVLDAHHDGRVELGAALAIFSQRSDVEVVPTFSARSITSAGTLAATDFERLAENFLDQVRAAHPVDAAYLSLHGAMSAEGEGDPEGYLLQEIRKILGDEVPIVISLDLHGILTDRMLQHIDGLTVYHTYPHVDFADTGERAARLLLRIIDERLHPIIAKVSIPALVRGDELITESGLLGTFVRQCEAIERQPRGLAAGMFIGNPFTDVPELRSNSIVIADDDAEWATREAERLATDFWDVRERLQASLVPLDEAVRAALEQSTGTTVLVDAADATSSGASGDSNAILRALLDAGYRGAGLIPLVDPAAVSSAMRAGIGATIRVPLGGAIDPRFDPVTMEVRVRMLSDGNFRNESDGSIWRAGNSAVLQADNFTLIVTSHAVSLYNRSLFLAHGQDPTQFDLVVVKSPHCEARFFKDWAALYINVDAPGSTSANLPSLGHVVCGRPIFPLDDPVTFQAKAQIFRRVPTLRWL